MEKYPQLICLYSASRFRPVGSSQEVTSDFRLIAATNRNLDQSVQATGFRQDLLFRLRSTTIDLPPLRERPVDIKDLAIYYITKICDRYGMGTKGFSPEFFETLMAYSWPGNVRQLKNAIDRAVLLCENEFINIEDFGIDVADVSEHTPDKTLKQARESIDRQLINYNLIFCNGNLSETARRLDIDRGTLRELLKKYNIDVKEIK